jgi:hypothetical protein
VCFPDTGDKHTTVFSVLAQDQKFGLLVATSGDTGTGRAGEERRKGERDNNDERERGEKELCHTLLL